MLFALMLLAMPWQLRAQGEEQSPYGQLHVQDQRLAAIAERMLGGNVHLCRQTMPLTGMILHSADQYSNPAADWFANGEVAISAVLPASPAELAGFTPGDGLSAVNGGPLATEPVVEGEPRRDTVLAQIADHHTATPLALTYRRGEGQRVASVNAPAGCRALVEVLAETDRIARSDGRVIQVSLGMMVRVNDDHLAAIFAHELAHSVLEHRRRLEEAGVRGGFFGEFGRDRRLARQVEIEADRLSVHLLANAGYDPQIAIDFWQSDIGRAQAGGVFRSRRYPSREDRIALLQEEIISHLQTGGDPSPAAHLLELRDAPFTDQ